MLDADWMLISIMIISYDDECLDFSDIWQIASFRHADMRYKLPLTMPRNILMKPHFSKIPSNTGEHLRARRSLRRFPLGAGKAACIGAIFAVVSIIYVNYNLFSPLDWYTLFQWRAAWGTIIRLADGLFRMSPITIRDGQSYHERDGVNSLSDFGLVDCLISDHRRVTMRYTKPHH